MDSRLDQARAAFFVAARYQEFAEARMRAPQRRSSSGDWRRRAGLRTKMTADCVAHERPQFLICHSKTST
jgi:hypothetical protein